MQKTLIAFFILIVSSQAHAQVFKEYVFPASEPFVNTTVDNSIEVEGGIIVCGHLENPAVYHEMLISKFDFEGNLIWSVKTIAGSWNRAFFFKSNDGYVYFMVSQTSIDHLVIKLDPITGEVHWQKKDQGDWSGLNASYMGKLNIFDHDDRYIGVSKGEDFILINRYSGDYTMLKPLDKTPEVVLSDKEGNQYVLADDYHREFYKVQKNISGGKVFELTAETSPDEEFLSRCDPFVDKYGVPYLFGYRDDKYYLQSLDPIDGSVVWECELTEEEAQELKAYKVKGNILYIVFADTRVTYDGFHVARINRKTGELIWRYLGDLSRNYPERQWSYLAIDCEDNLFLGTEFVGEKWKVLKFGAADGEILFEKEYVDADEYSDDTGNSLFLDDSGSPISFAFVKNGYDFESHFWKLDGVTGEVLIDKNLSLANGSDLPASTSKVLVESDSIYFLKEFAGKALIESRTSEYHINWRKEIGERSAINQLMEASGSRLFITLSDPTKSSRLEVQELDRSNGEVLRSYHFDSSSGEVKPLQIDVIDDKVYTLYETEGNMRLHVQWLEEETDQDLLVEENRHASTYYGHFNLMYLYGEQKLGIIGQEGVYQLDLLTHDSQKMVSWDWPEEVFDHVFVDDNTIAVCGKGEGWKSIIAYVNLLDNTFSQKTYASVGGMYQLEIDQFKNVYASGTSEDKVYGYRIDPETQVVTWGKMAMQVVNAVPVVNDLKVNKVNSEFTMGGEFIIEGNHTDGFIKVLDINEELTVGHLDDFGTSTNRVQSIDALSSGVAVAGGMAERETGTKGVVYFLDGGITSIDDELSGDLSKFQVYPNPTSGDVHVTNIEHALPYHVLDVAGKVCDRGTISQANSTIRLNKLDAGVYFITLFSGNKEKVTKVVKY